MRAVPPSRYLVFFGIAALGCAADLSTKSWIFDILGAPVHNQRPPWWIWKDVVGFETSLNLGALFGIGQGRGVVFSLLSVVAIVGILWWLFWAGAARQWLLTTALGCITAGILGNLYDRLGCPGLKWEMAGPFHNVGDPVYAVRDWILVMIGNFPWPTFNIADSLLVSGAALLAWHAFFVKQDEKSVAIATEHKTA
jgi:signal peptidase II